MAKDDNPARPSNAILKRQMQLQDEWVQGAMEPTSRLVHADVPVTSFQITAIIEYLDERWEKSQRPRGTKPGESTTSIDQLFDMLEAAGATPTLHGKPVTKEQLLEYIERTKLGKSGG